MAKNPHAVALGKLRRKPDDQVSAGALAKRRYRADVAAGKRTIKSRKNKPLEPTG